VTVTRVEAHPDRYRDSLVLLAATAAMGALPDVEWAAAVMATPRGTDELLAGGVDAPDLANLTANDLVLAVRAGDDASAAAALAAGASAALAERGAAATAGAGPPGPTAPRSLVEATRDIPEANVAIVSVPGAYAALEAHHALSAGMHVLLFSDNVSLDEEVELKARAASLGLLVMGPGAGTAVLSGTGLGFANVVRRGPVGVVAAAGTGAQEVSVLLDRWGVGVSHVIGIGGRDLSERVDGLMARTGVRALAADRSTRALLLVSKPPAEAVARRVLAAADGFPTAAALLGLDPAAGLGLDGQVLAPTLEAGAAAAARLVGVTPPPLDGGLVEAVAAAAGRLPGTRTAVRGYFSGGTLCYESQVILGGLLGAVRSNEPLRPDLALAHGAPAGAGEHACLDLGAEEYTVGRPHPMIDPAARVDLLRRHYLAPPPGEEVDTTVAVVLLDVVLGHGSHPDPAGVLAPVCADIRAAGGPRVIAYVLGTGADPQGWSAQRRRLVAAGCIVPDTNARAAYAAAALSLRRPDVAAHGLPA
jgi:FdrA protein